MMLFVLMCVAAYVISDKIFMTTEDYSQALMCFSIKVISVISIMIGSPIILYFFGTPRQAWRVDPMMSRICVRNGIGETPCLISVDIGPDGKVKKYRFLGYGIPVSFYEDHVTEIEAALNVSIAKIVQGPNRRYVDISLVDYRNAMENVIFWDDRFISDDEFVLVLGEGLLGQVTIDLNKIPHMLIGGSTGSGKSVLLKTVLYQCAKKGSKVYIADFKGGVDFNRGWAIDTEIITSIDNLLPVLSEIIKKLEERKRLFYEAGAVNIANYRLKTSKQMERIIFACDEIAELLDKSGLDKTTKEKVMQAESMISTIARQGRAFGINLILATQRPDANILSGQIRNNIDYRVCGRADDVLSKIVLDNTEASERIPKYEQGLFLNHENELFRAYLFDDSML